jgi:rod shape determining protein RodA
MKTWGARRRYNWLLLLTLVLLDGLGLVNLSSASRGAATNLALVQGIWLGASLLLAVGLSLIDYRLFERLAYPLFFASLLALVAVLA